MKFYLFEQGNPGNSFSVSDWLGHYVFIQAGSAKQANERAEEIGIYFFGVEDEHDCPCCGDRWSMVSEESAMDTPLIHGKTPREFVNQNPGRVVIVYRVDAREIIKHGSAETAPL